jgi:glycogen(starch) synthase
MKVLMTADAIGGVWTYVVDLCRGLAVHGIEVVLAVLGPTPSRAQRQQAQALENVTLRIGSWKLEWMDDPWQDVEKAGDWLLPIADEEHVDLVHVNGYAHAALEYGRPVVCVAHSCVCSWWTAVHGERAPARWNTYRESVAAGLKAAWVVVAPTQAFLAELQRQYGVLKHGLVIGNGCELPRLEPERERRPVILACGRVWDGAKNFATLDAAVPDLPWPAYVAGDSVSPDGRRCELKHLKGLGVLPREAVQCWLNDAAIFAHSPVYEPFGLAVLEAAARGCTLVLSDVPTLRELWNGAAVFAPPRDSFAFHEQLRRLIEHPNERLALARAATERARQFDLSSMCTRYASVYREVSGRPPCRAVA